MGCILMKFHGEKYIHESWFMMPNHIHLLFKPLVPMEKPIEAWKVTLPCEFRAFLDTNRPRLTDPASLPARFM